MVPSVAHTCRAQSQPQSAHSYFDELYKAGGLDHLADGYVCFDDDPQLQTFFIFGESETLKSFLESEGDFTKMPKKLQAQINKGFLNVRQYDRGVPVGDDEDYYNKEGATWVTETYRIQRTPMRIRLSIAWETLRYKKNVEVLNADSTLKTQYARYGRCEQVSDAVQQKGN